MEKFNTKIIVMATCWVFLSYFIFFFLNDIQIINFLTKEDGFFESIGAVFFLLSAILFFMRFLKNETVTGFFIIKKKNLFFLLLSFLFLFTFLEEISWGQRMFNISTPQFLQDANMQKEINFHNLKILNIKIPGLSNTLQLNMLFQLFWFVFCFLIPIFYKYNKITKKIIKKTNLPVGPIFIGFLFIFNYFGSRLMQLFEFNFELSQFVVEIKESNAGLIFFLLSIWFIIKYNSMTNTKETIVKETV